MNVAFILLIVLTLARLWIGLQLFLTARKTHLNNLYWLAAVFALAVYSIFTPLTGSPLANAWIFNLGFIAGHFCLTMFIHTTFYRGRKSPVFIVLGIFVVALVANIYLLSIDNPSLATVVAGVSLINWIWHLIVARSAYAAIANDPSVEKWIKARYRLMIVYVILITLSSIQVVISNTSLASLIPAFVIPFSILLVLGSIVLQFLVWVMPEPFRLWLNRTQQARPAAEEQQPRSMLDVFGLAMTTGTGLNTIACFYAIRSAIGKEIGSEASETIRAHIKTMTYQDWETLLQNPELRRLLINGGADKVAAEKAIENARQALVEKQSLLTFSTR
jgi:hypothetical protein